MAEQKSISIYDILKKISELSGASIASLSLEDALKRHLEPLDIAELLVYLATYLGYDSERLCATIGGDSTIEELYQWFRREQDAAGVPDKPFSAAGLYKDDVKACWDAHERLIRSHRNRGHLREAVKILEAVKSQQESEVLIMRAEYAKEKKGCTGTAVVLTLILMIPAALFLGGVVRKVVLGLLAVHLLATLVFQIWGLNGDACKQREAKIAQAEKTVQETEAKLAGLRAEIAALPET